MSLAPRDHLHIGPVVVARAELVNVFHARGERRREAAPGAEPVHARDRRRAVLESLEPLAIDFPAKHKICIRKTVPRATRPSRWTVFLPRFLAEISAY